MLAKTRRTGFTLIELLVVIAIIALLIGLLLAVLGSSLLSAVQVSCKTNLKSLAEASIASATDNKGLYIQGSNGGSPQLAEHPTLGGDRDQWSGYLDNYTADDGSPSMYCPFFEDDELHSWPSGWGNTSWGTDVYWMGYANFSKPDHVVGNSSWRARVDGPRYVDTTPTGMPLFGDMIEGNLNGNSADWIHFSHTQGRALSGGGETAEDSEVSDIVGPDGFNTAYVDGSVDWTDFSPNSSEFEISFSTDRSDQVGFMWNFNSAAAEARRR